MTDILGKANTLLHTSTYHIAVNYSTSLMFGFLVKPLVINRVGKLFTRGYVDQ